ncbi:MAG: hypothetical protein WCK34_05465 [Bacteroidota bacterium]
MSDEYIQIKAILDHAVLSENPMKRLSEALPKVRQFASVDSAWITGNGIFVKFSKGATISWIVNPEDIKP